MTRRLWRPKMQGSEGLNQRVGLARERANPHFCTIVSQSMGIDAVDVMHLSPF